MNKFLSSVPGKRPSAPHARGVLLVTGIMAIGLVILALLPDMGPGSDRAHDKFVHAAAFACLIVPSALLFPSALPWLVPLLAVLSGMIELLQPAFGREASWSDFLANLVGLSLGVLTGRILLWAVRPPFS